MKQLPTVQTTFWGSPCTCHSALLDAVYGDGSEWVWVQYLDDRPDYYVARCGAGTIAAMKTQSDAWYDLLDDIIDAIEEEAGEGTTEEQEDEREKTGFISDTRAWPIPPGGLSSGTTWGKYNPTPEALALANGADQPRPREKSL